MTAKSGAGNQDMATQSSTATSEKAPLATAPLDDAAVAEYLRENTDFFIRNSTLLLELTIPHESGKAISLLEKQVAVYRNKQDNIEQRFQDFLDNARVNDNLFEKTRLVILDLIQCTTLQALSATIAKRICNDFDASISALAFINDNNITNAQSARIISTKDAAAILGSDYEKQRTWCGRLNKEQQKILFREEKSSMISAALVPVHLPETAAIRKSHGLPLLLIGSAEEQHFNSSLDTLFLDFIGEVLSVHMQQLASGS